MTRDWFGIYSNVVTLTAYMAEHGYTAEDVAHAVEKPWKYEDEFNEATKATLNDE